MPEPLTIIGSGIALGFGGFLKRKQKAAQNKS
ncbi:MAG: PEP-CTERM sorting domain-containing protein [Snowella sp.]